MRKLSLLNRVQLLILLTFLFTSLYTFSSEANSTPTIYIDPPSTSANIGESCSINATIANVTDLGGWEFKLYYQNNILSGVTATEGPFLKQGGSTAFFTVDFNNNYNSTHGRIWLTCTLIGEVPGVDGDGTLATIIFIIVGSGTTTLHLADTVLGDSQATPIDHTSTDGTVYTLLGDVNGDGTVDIYDAILLATAFGSTPGEPKWDARCDLNKDDVIDIYDAIILANNYGGTD